MAEAAGLAVGVIGLAALFDSAVQCFDYIQLGRSFGKDFHTCQLKLDNAKLRLSRWGASLGLNGEVKIIISPREEAQARALMGQILTLFAEAEGISDKLKSRARTHATDGTSTGLSLALCDPGTDLDSTSNELPELMRRLAIGREKQTGLRQKAKWALYEQKNFNRLLEDIAELVDALVSLFPASHLRERELCKSEVAVLGQGETCLSLLRDNAVHQQDRPLETVGAVEQPETTPKPSSTIPFLRDRDFVVRESILNQINEKTTPGFWAALVGLGGVGKSQLAIEHGYRVREQSPETWVFWVYASNSARFEESYREIADRAKIPGRDQSDNILKLVYDWLCRQNGQWLIILDNADNTSFLRKESNGMGLIKEAALQLVGETDLISVDPMDEAHAMALLRIKLGTKNDDEALANLAAMLEYMPLAIAQAAAFISHRAPRFSVEQYLEKFQKSDSRKTNLLSHEGGQIRRDHDAKNSILTTWQISFDHIRETRPSAADLLSFMSFFDRQGIPEFMLRLYRKDMGQDETISEKDNSEYGDAVSCISESSEYADALSITSESTDVSEAVSGTSVSSEDEDFENDLQTLRHYSFISVGTDPSVFEMHRLVQLATRTWLKAYGSLETWKLQFIRQLRSQFPWWELYVSWATCQVLFPHAKLAIGLVPENGEFKKDWACLLIDAATYAREKGNAADARVLSAKLVEVCDRELGKDHALTLLGIQGLSESYGVAGDWAKAAELAEEVTEKRKQLLGIEHPDTLLSLINLAWTYAALGRLGEAEEIQVQALETLKRIFGEEHPATLHVMDHLASTYSDQSRWKESQELGMKVLDIRKRTLGMEHPRTLLTMDNLARVYCIIGRLEEAEELGEQAVETLLRITGLEHPLTLTAMFNLSATYRAQGRLKEAEELGLKVLETRTKVQGKEHSGTRTAMAGVATTYWEQERWEEAEELMIQLMESRMKVLGTAHPSTLESMHNLAWTWWKQGKQAEAIDLMGECVQLEAKHLGPEHPYTLLSSETLAGWKLEVDGSKEGGSTE
ncbi:hypothetical protein FQN49_006529 [Arthroderma sp. PD_2]|nr:hypothetical protein FQN49_006529 [Arthroderma sp. PD_2]